MPEKCKRKPVRLLFSTMRRFWGHRNSSTIYHALPGSILTRPTAASWSCSALRPCVCACVFVHVPNVSSKAQLSPPTSVISRLWATFSMCGWKQPLDDLYHKGATAFSFLFEESFEWGLASRYRLHWCNMRRSHWPTLCGKRAWCCVNPAKPCMRYFFPHFIFFLHQQQIHIHLWKVLSICRILICIFYFIQPLAAGWFPIAC